MWCHRLSSFSIWGIAPPTSFRLRWKMRSWFGICAKMKRSSRRGILKNSAASIAMSTREFHWYPLLKSPCQLRVNSIHACGTSKIIGQGLPTWSQATWPTSSQGHTSKPTRERLSLKPCTFWDRMKKKEALRRSPSVHYCLKYTA